MEIRTQTPDLLNIPRKTFIPSPENFFRTKLSATFSEPPENHTDIFAVENPPNCQLSVPTDELADLFTYCHFYRAAWNATRSCDEISVCPSVRPSVCPSVCLSNAWIVIKRKKNQSRFLYHAKEHSL